MISSALHHVSPSVLKASMTAVGFKTDGTHDPLLIPHSAYTPGATYRTTTITSGFLRSLFHEDNLTAAPFLNKSSPPFPTFTTKTTTIDQCVFRTENRVKPVIDNITKEVAIATYSSLRASNTLKNSEEALSEKDIAFVEGTSAISSILLHTNPDLVKCLNRGMKAATLSLSSFHSIVLTSILFCD